MSINNLLNIPCGIYRKSTTIDDYGNTSDTWTEISDDDLCFIQYNGTGAKLKLETTGQEISDTYTIFFLPEVDIQKGDRIVVDTDYYYVHKPHKSFKGRTGKIHHLECICSTQEL